MLSDEFRDFRQLRQARNHARRAERKNVPHANNQYKWADAMRSIRVPHWRGYSPLKSFVLVGRRHPGIVHVDQPPAIVFALIDLSFPAVGSDGRAILAEFRRKIAIKFSDGGIAIYVTRIIARRAVPFGNCLS